MSGNSDESQSNLIQGRPRDRPSGIRRRSGVSLCLLSFAVHSVILSSSFLASESRGWPIRGPERVAFPSAEVGLDGVDGPFHPLCPLGRPGRLFEEEIWTGMWSSLGASSFLRFWLATTRAAAAAAKSPFQECFGGRAGYRSCRASGLGHPRGFAAPVALPRGSTRLWLGLRAPILPGALLLPLIGCAHACVCTTISIGFPGVCWSPLVGWPGSDGLGQGSTGRFPLGAFRALVLRFQW